jgi:hypothetical protein
VPAAARSARLTPTDEPDDALPLDAVRSPVPDTRGPSLEAGHCAYCGGTLPTGREVNFCPHCGGSQREPRCPSCHSEIDLGWRHCIACGATLPL